jgi:hypothetical protein
MMCAPHLRRVGLRPQPGIKPRRGRQNAPLGIACRQASRQSILSEALCRTDAPREAMCGAAVRLFLAPENMPEVPLMQHFGRAGCPLPATPLGRLRYGIHPGPRRG